MVLSAALLINNIGLFILEIIGYHACHSVVMLLVGYFHLCQAILCTVRIVSRSTQFTYTSRQTYGLARVGVVGELVAFISFLALSISVFLESVKHIVDVIFGKSEGENNSSAVSTGHGHGYQHGQILYPNFILGVGFYATISNCVLGIVIIYSIMKRWRKFDKNLEQRRSSLKQPFPKKLLSKSLLISDTLSIHHSLLQVFNMLLGPLAILACGILLITVSDKHATLLLFSRLVDPIICSLLFLSYLYIVFIPMRDVIHLVLQANPCSLKFNEVEQILRDSIPGVLSIHELHIWRLTPQQTLATVHIVFNSTEDMLTKYGNIHFILQTLHIDHVTIQPEFSLPTNENEKVGCHYPCSTDDTKCGPLQCCEDPKVDKNTITP